MMVEQHSDKPNKSQYLECGLSNCLRTWETVDSEFFSFFFLTLHLKLEFLQETSTFMLRPINDKV